MSIKKKKTGTLSALMVLNAVTNPFHVLDNIPLLFEFLCSF